MSSKYLYLVHRCPKCDSKQVEDIKPKEKSKIQKGLELAGGFAEGWFLGTNGSITDWVSNKYYDPSKQPKFRCRSCSNTWITANMVDETPDDVLEEEKKRSLENQIQKFIANIILLLVFGCVTYWSFKYCWINDFTSTHIEDMWLLGPSEVTDYHWGWLGVGLIFLICLSLTIMSISFISENISDYRNIKDMSLNDFRTSVYR